jgi:hypothetical protein
MRRFSFAAFALLSCFALSGCGSSNLGEALGLSPEMPDEFKVVSRPPLSIPPDMIALPKPNPGAMRPQDQTAEDKAAGALFGVDPKTTKTMLTSPIEGAFVQRAGVADASPEIRKTIDRDSADMVASNDSFIESLLFWKESEQPAMVVNARAENARLRQALDAKQPVNAGDTPMIKRRSKALIDLF